MQKTKTYRFLKPIIPTILVIMVSLLSAFPGLAATFEVINTNNAGTGSLREAITSANANAGADIIEFNIPGSGPHTIYLLSALPIITEQLTINGYTQPGAFEATASVPAILKIVITGDALGLAASGLVFNGADNSLIKGLVINGFDLASTNAGIEILSGDNIQIEGNFIGTDASGTSSSPNSKGILVAASGTNTQIGGTSVVQRNILSGNSRNGIEIKGSFFTIQNNYIGTNAAGTAALANLNRGILVDECEGQIINNVISGNTWYGIQMDGTYTYAPGTFLTIYDNKIGTDKSGTNAIGNGVYGILIQPNCYNVLIGGTGASEPNIIANNIQEGVVIKGDFVTVSANSIYNNGDLGIDLGSPVPDGVTANDSADVDTGPNGFQNYPIFYSDPASNSLQGYLTSTPSRSFRIEYFSNPIGKDASGNGEGQVYLGAQTVNTDASGLVYLSYNAVSGSNFSATATDLTTGQTSEFSRYITPPTAENDLAGTSVDMAVTIYVQENDYAGNASPITTTAISSGPSNGTAVIQVDGSVLYTPNAAFTGYDYFDYVICENTGGLDFCDTATVTVEVYPMMNACNGNATDTFYVSSALINTSYTWTLPAGASIAETINDTMVVIDWTGASVSIDEICIEGENACGSSQPICLSISINNCNTQPIAVDDYDTTAVDIPLIIDILANDSDPDGSIDPTSVDTTGLIQVSNGTVTINPTTGAITYVPDACFIGNDSLEYVVCDDGIPSMCDTAMIRITVIDTMPPVLAGVPADMTVECDAVPAAANPTATDNCDPSVTISLSETSTQTSDGSCTDDAYVITRTWTATDDSGNTDTGVQVITTQDTTNPVLSGIPADITVECDAVPAPANPTATDNCDTNVSISLSETSTQTSDGSCTDDTYVITRTWTATDNCGNTDSGVQIITVEDTTPPALAGIPGDVTVTQGSEPAPASPTATDNCDPSVTISFSESIDTVECNYTITRIWTATDNCGLVDVDSQLITVTADLTANAIISSDYNGEAISCPGASDGSIDVTASGGIGPYSYIWNDLGGDAMWTFEGNTNDVSGNNHHAIALTGNESYSADAVEGDSSFYFDGTTNIQYNDGTFMDSTITQRTITMWVKTTAPIDKFLLFEEGSDQNGIAIRLKDNEVHAAVSQGYWDQEAGAIAYPLDGQWHHIALVYDDGAITLYLDGVPGTTTNTGFGTITLSGDGGGLGGSINNDAFGNPKSKNFIGWMDDVRYNTSALSTLKINQIMSGAANRTQLSAGTYTVTVTDSYGCTVAESVTLNDPTPISLSTTHINTECGGATSGSIDLTPSGGTGSLSFNWSNGETTEDINNLGVGTYTVTVTDANACTDTTSVTIDDSGTLAISASITDVLCNGGATGAIDITVTGGIPGIFSYAWSSGQFTEDIIALAAGNYTVTVTDGGGCTKAATFTVATLNAVFADAGADQDHCEGESLVLGGSPTASGGTAPYTYTWDNGAGNTANPVVSPASTTTYNLTVTDFLGCSETDAVTITVLQGVNAYIDVEDYGGYGVSCPGGSDGDLQAKPFSGSGNLYTYLWNNGETDKQNKDLPAGNYWVIMTRISTGCADTLYATITEPPPMDVTFTINSDYNGYGVSCQEATDGDVTASTTNGAGGYTYNWSTGSTTDNISGVGVGTYYVTVTDLNFCTAVDSITLSAPPALTPVASVTSNYNGQHVTCPGASDGSINVTTSGGYGSYSYVWDNGPTTNSQSGLPAGTYTVTVTDDNGCTATTSVDIVDPAALSITTTVTSDYNGSDLTCVGATDGEASGTPSGGTAPYTYVWNTGDTDSLLNNVGAGTYTLTITDGNGCTTSETVTISDPPVLSVNISITSDYNGQSISCNGASDGTATAGGVGGSGTYTYAWSNAQSGANLVNVGDGTYTVTVTDGNGCTATSSVTFNEPSVVVATTSVTSNYNGFGVSCPLSTDGTALAGASGGNGGYTYAWSNGGNTAAISGLAAGSYIVTVTDNNGCTDTEVVTLTAPPEMALTFTKFSHNGTEISCPGDNDAGAVVSVTNGASPYSYNWSTGSVTDTIENVGAGTYYVTVTDFVGCEKVDSVIFADPAPVAASANVISDYNGYDISCLGLNDGFALASGSGGSGNYTYLWNNGQTTDTLKNVTAGTYVVTVTDENGCTALTSVSLTNPADMDVSITSADVSDCGTDDGIILIIASGGIQEYEYKIDGSPYQSSNSFTGLAVGTYNIYVRNTVGTCETGPFPVSLETPETPTINSVTIINPTTTTSNDGSLLVNSSGNGTQIEYRIVGVTPWQTSNLFTGLDEGTYDIEVRYNGFTCITSTTVTLTAGGGIVGNGASTNFCSGDINGDRIAEIYYIPFPEDQAKTSFESIRSASGCDDPETYDTIYTYISIGIIEANTTINYDHWEDGFETNLNFPVQATTEIWGDGNAANGFAPGFPSDLFVPGDIIVLNNGVHHASTASVIDYDGGDKMAGLGNLAVTRLAWPDVGGTLFAGAIEVYPENFWGTDYEIPVGEDADVNGAFEYVGAIIMANTDNTTLNIDSDANGSVDITTILNEGQSYLIDGGINVGATISASATVQTHLITGDVCANYVMRWFTLTPTANWSDSYYNPVGTQNGSGEDDDPTFVHLYNPNASAINVEWETNAGAQPAINIPSGTTVWVEVPDGSGTHFYTNNNKPFYAVATIDSRESTTIHDWGFALLPADLISQQITMVGFAPGHTPGVPSSDNTAPIWITGDHPSGSTASFTICIDYNGDGGAFVDGNGVAYDATRILDPLDLEKIYDPDGDQTGMRIWVCDGSDAIIAGAWGQDPTASQGGGQADELDLGTGLPNGVPFNASKCVDLNNDYNGNGLFEECDEVIYSIMIYNTGVLPLSTGTINIKDTLPAEVTYIPNSTLIFSGTGVDPVTDDVNPASPFPLDENGLNHSSIILPGDSILIRFEASINSLASATFIQNIAHIQVNSRILQPEVTFPAQPPLPPTVPGMPPLDTILACHESIPDAPFIDTLGAVLTETVVPGSCSASFVMTRSWTFTDYCGNTAEYTQTLTVQDTIPPFLIGVPTNVSVDPDSVPPPPVIIASDPCDADIPVFFTETTIPGTCNDYIERVWSATDDCGNEARDTQIITLQTNLVVNTTITSDYNGRDINCVGASNGNATTTVSGGTGSYSYNWSNGQTGPNLTNVPAGSYTVTVSDGGGCTTEDYVTLVDPPALNISASVTSNYNGSDVSCFGSADGTALASGSGGTGGASSFTYSWSTGDSGNSVAGLSAGTYTVTVTDANGCTASTSVTVSNPAVLSVSTAVTSNFNGADLSCPSATDGAALATPGGGTPGYIYSWSTGQTTATLSNVGAGTYTVTLTDANGCTATSSVTLNDPAALNITANVTSDYNGEDISCNGASDGTASANATGGTGAMSYTWSNAQSGSSLLNVTAGTYTVTATDANGCTVSTSVTLTDPPVLSASASVTSDYNGEDISCNTATDGSALSIASGGLAPYSYAWSNGQSVAALTNVGAGTYTVTVTDANNCTATASVTLSEPTAITATVGPANTICNGDATNLTASATGGTGTYTYSWSNGLGSGSSKSVSPVVTTTYTVTATDVNGCTDTDNVTITVNPCSEDCTNGIDDDGDSLVDCADPDCAPTANDESLNACDNADGGGSGIFYLHDANFDITGGTSGVTISYHATLADADADINPLLSPYTSSGAIVIARVERTSTGCYNTSNLTLVVGAACAENCNNNKDEDGDGLIDCEDPDCPCCDAYAPAISKD